MVGLDGRFWLPMEFSAPVRNHAKSACDEKVMYAQIASKTTYFTLHLIAGPGKGLKNDFIKKLLPFIANWQIRIQLLKINLFNPNFKLIFPLPIPAFANILKLACCHNQCMCFLFLFSFVCMFLRCHCVDTKKKQKKTKIVSGKGTITMGSDFEKSKKSTCKQWHQQQQQQHR